MITHPKSAVAFCPEGGATILSGAATHLLAWPNCENIFSHAILSFLLSTFFTCKRKKNQQSETTKLAPFLFK